MFCIRIPSVMFLRYFRNCSYLKSKPVIRLVSTYKCLADHSLCFCTFDSYRSRASSLQFVPFYVTFRFKTLTSEEKSQEASVECQEKNDTTVASAISATQESNTDSSQLNSILYMRGLPYSVTNDDIIQFFRPVDVVPVKIVLKHDRYGYFNGIAELHFSKDDIPKALSRHNSHIGIRYIELSEKPFISMNANRYFQRPLNTTQDVKEHDSKSSGAWIKLRGLPYNATPEDVHNFFAPLQISPVNILFKYNANGKPTGLCDVKFRTAEEAALAVKRNKAYIGNRYIDVFLTTSFSSGKDANM